MLLTIPDPSLVLLIGASGSGKSTFARGRFKPTEILSSDFCRGLVTDDEADQNATEDAFQILRLILSKRLRYRRLAVIDATNVIAECRRPLLDLAVEFETPAVALVFQLSEEACLARNACRPYRQVPIEIVRQQRQDLENSIPQFEAEGFEHVYYLRSEREIEDASITRIVTRRDSSELPS